MARQRDVLEPLARPDVLADGRSAGQRRSDALVEVFAGAARWMDLPAAGGQRPQLSYVTTEQWVSRSPAPSLADWLAQDPHPHAASSCGASAAWTGPATRARIDVVLCDARLQRLLVSPAGEIVSLVSLNEQITPAQRRAVSARDRHCIAKGCTRPPAFCDVHHLTHREHGGKTEIENLALAVPTPPRAVAPRQHRSARPAHPLAPRPHTRHRPQPLG